MLGIFKKNLHMDQFKIDKFKNQNLGDQKVELIFKETKKNIFQLKLLILIENFKFCPINKQNGKNK